MSLRFVYRTFFYLYLFSFTFITVPFLPVHFFYRHLFCRLPYLTGDRTSNHDLVLTASWTLPCVEIKCVFVCVCIN